MSETASIAQQMGISPQSTMGYSYSGARISLATADTKWTWSVLHPWAKAANLHAFFSHPKTTRAGVDSDRLPILTTPMGVGSAGRQGGAAAWANFWSRNSRTYLPGRPSRSTAQGTAWLLPGMAPIAAPGTSVHEDDTYQARALAVDAIGWEDGTWVKSLAPAAKLLTFENTGDEPWHSQPLGYAKSKSALIAELRLRPLPPLESLLSSLPRIPLALAPPTALQGVPDVFTPINPFRNSDTRVWGFNDQSRLDFGLPSAVMTFGLNPDIFPAGVIAVSMNLKVIGNGNPGWVTVWPSGDTPPDVSMVDLPSGVKSPINNSVIVGVVNNTFRIRSTVRSHLVVDITGYWTA